MPTIKGEDVERALLTTCAVTALAIFLLIVRKYPKLGLVSWLFVLCFVPFWIGVDVRAYVPAVSAAAMAIALGLGSFQNPRVTFVDWAILALLLVFASGAVLGLASVSGGFTLVVSWGGGYLLGRVLLVRLELEWIYRAMAVAFTAVSILAILEFTSGQNYFVQWSSGNSLYDIWGPLQYRSSELRVEGAFGHSIALGASLAMAIPLTMATTFRLSLRMVMVLSMLTASFLTLSRIGMICSVLGLFLAMLLMKNDLTQQMKLVLSASAAAVTLAAMPVVNAMFISAGSEASGSAGYRADLLSLFSDMRTVGLSPAFTISAKGEVSFGSFRSIDSALILMGLTYGSIFLLIVGVLLLVSLVVLCQGRATAPTIAIVAQIPALATVALITQYAVFLCVMAGLAVASQAAASRHDRPVAKSVRPLTIARDSSSEAGAYVRIDERRHDGAKSR